ncbi:16S rRNA (guanine(966)-N(2))-methyltransferase RsmD [Oscillospiraceae bacterium MB08-C2-2]|nr:16S rRNA (guanine(966)-N(2))-methyltransferase RsmD [Oscillospiraceae bacterium MB08-C2-2]
MRVITGSARGRRLATPPGTDVRPTSDMAKEAIFSILQMELEEAAVLDLFAGSGQLGIEALSRGARSCVFVDNAKLSQKAVRENLASTQLASKGRLIPMDAVTFLQSTAEIFDIALLDPPYQQGILEKALPLVASHMRESGIIVCETERGEDLPEVAGSFTKHREYRYGKAKVTVYRQPLEEELQ